MSGRGLGFLAISALLLSAGTVARGQATGTPIPVQAAVGIEPDTVRIGDPFLIQIGIRAPLGATVAFPPAPDSTGAVQGLDPVRVETKPDSGGVVQWGYYRVAAWDIGDQPITLGDVVVTVGGRSRRITMAGRKVFVVSVLPADTAQRVPKPPRPLYELPPRCGGSGRPRGARRRAPPPLVVVASAQARPADCGARSLLAGRARVRADRSALGSSRQASAVATSTLVVEVLRDYLAARYPSAPLSLTSTELLAALRGQRDVPNDRLMRILNEADLVKFAQRPVTADRARRSAARRVRSSRRSTRLRCRHHRRRRRHELPRPRSSSFPPGRCCSCSRFRCGGSGDGATGRRQSFSPALPCSSAARARDGVSRCSSSFCATSCSPARSSRSRAHVPVRAPRTSRVRASTSSSRSTSRAPCSRRISSRRIASKSRRTSSRSSSLPARVDRIGVVAFAAEALTQVPLTTDYPVVSAAVDNLAPGQLEDGTAIGTAIATAANRLRTRRDGRR